MGHFWTRRPIQVASTGGINKFASNSSFSGTATVLKTLTASSQTTLTKALTVSSQATLTKAVSISSGLTITKTLTLSSRFDFGTVQTATTASTPLNLYGISSIARKSSAGASTELYTLGAPPVVGLMKYIYATNCQSTRTARVTLGAGKFQTTDSTDSFTKATFNAGGDSLLLVGASTTVWAIMANVGGVTFT